MALKFNIKSTQDCGKLKYTNCSTYCSPDNYVFELLVASIRPRLRFNGDALQVTTDILTSLQLDTVEWEINGGNTITSTNIPTNTGIVEFTQIIPGVQAGVNTVILTVTDVDGNNSTLTFAFNAVITNGQFSIVWLVIPELNVTTGNTLEVGFNNATTVANGNLVNTTIDPSTIVFDPDGSSNFNSVQIFTYTSDGNYNISYGFEETVDNTPVNLQAFIKIEEDPTDCTNQLTESNIDSVILTATSPKGTTYTTEITNNFINLTTFDVLATDFGSFSTFESGIWTFQTIVTKVTNTGTFIFADTIKLVIICKEECGFNAYVAAYAEEEADCCSDCKIEKEKKIILMQTYIDAIKNASACGELNKITKFINLLQRLLSNKNCNC
jgi:hypothetical protein